MCPFDLHTCQAAQVMWVTPTLLAGTALIRGPSLVQGHTAGGGGPPPSTLLLSFLRCLMLPARHKLWKNSSGLWP